MRATTEDFKKVMDVAQEQITSSLKLSPLKMEEFKKGLKTYSEISESRKEEAKNRGEREGKAIQHLRSLITPEVVELIQQQRLNFLVSGTKFLKFKKEGKGKFLLVKLSPNHKAFHYGDWNDDATAIANNIHTMEASLSHKLPLAEIKDIQTGSNCPFIKDTNRRNRDRMADNLAISILRENGDTLDFIAPSQKSFDYWCDGMNALMRKEMTSEEATKDQEMLLSMEEKIRLLPLEGIEILDEQPPIPPPPPHFNFCQETPKG